MQALVYTRSVPRYLLARLWYRLRPRSFLPSLAPLRLREITLSRPGPDWVVLRTRICGVCGSDLRLLKGVESLLLEPYASFPAVLGHEVVGEVVEAPPGSEWRVGERVAVEPVLPCETRGLAPCRFCAKGEYNLCENFTRGGISAGAIIGFHRDAGGGMAEFMAAHPSRLVRLPEGMPDEAAALVDSLASALQPVLDNFPQPGDLVVVYGAGIIGQQLLRILQALETEARVVAVARYPFQEDLARAGGAETVLMEPGRKELAAAVGARHLPTILGGGNVEGGADFFFDCVGSKTSMQEGLLALRARGTYVLVGTAGTLDQVDLSSLWFRELKLTGSSMFSYGFFRGRKIRTYELAVELLARGDYPKEGLLSHLFPLEEYCRAFRTAFNKPRFESVKVAIDLRGKKD
ncbi:MAG: alcohol dehydrogenase [Deltaproteobacteria bacterium]|nr:MAG: alcohol dehydrogenase [Deltaproteobacteria bacterium]